MDGSRTGEVVVSSDLSETVRGAWMVIEAIPERLELKREVFGQLDELARASRTSQAPAAPPTDTMPAPGRGHPVLLT